MTGPNVLAELSAIEEQLDPANAEGTAGLRVLAYGEVSACLKVPGLPGLVCKRMSGFASAEAAGSYVELVQRYIDHLASAGIAVVPTEIVTVNRPGRTPVVYLVQQEAPAHTLGHRHLVNGDEASTLDIVDRVLQQVLALARANRARTDGLEVAIDAQLANWSLNTDVLRPGEPVLLDIGTPFMRHDGAHLIDITWLERPIPPVVRAYYRRQGLVGAYLDDYFNPRTVAVDLLGNFHKEGRADRIPVAVEHVNNWFADHADDLGPHPAITPEEVDTYYRRDADQLELYLRLRRADRFVRTKMLRRPYDFVLPGPVQR